MSNKLLGVSRSPKFSPNSVDRDAAIFQEVAHQLRAKGWQVDCVCEDNYVSANGYVGVFTMARDVQVLRSLSEEEKRGAKIINSANALLQASRRHLTELFEQNEVPVPASPVAFYKSGNGMVPQVRPGYSDAMHFPLWLKRSGACAQSAADVCFVETAEHLNDALQSYLGRNIDEVLVCEHLRGDLVKFYGVEGTGFFNYYYPTSDHAFSKFGLEKINGVPSGFPLNVTALKKCADRAAVLSGISVYGGDCIVASDGQFRIIDFNDWPSFSRCCEEAAKAIAEKIQMEMAGDICSVK